MFALPNSARLITLYYRGFIMLYSKENERQIEGAGGEREINRVMTYRKKNDNTAKYARHLFISRHKQHMYRLTDG